MSDPKSFTGKREEYKSWKWDMYNKFMWKLEKFNIDRHQIAYITNYLKNKSLFMVKVTVFIYLKLHLDIIFTDL